MGRTRKSPQKQIAGRESESSLIHSHIDSFVSSGESNILYLTGVPGSGKTHTTLSLLRSLSTPFSYINCSTLKNKDEIYSKIYGELSCIKKNEVKKTRVKRAASNGKENQVAKRSVQELRFHFSNCQSRHIIVIDEIDFLITKNEIFLYNLFEMPFIENSSVLLFVISNSLGSLSSKVESRIGKNRIEFKPYTSDQLLSIAQNEKYSVKNEIVEVVAKRIASSTGDIRKLKEVMENPSSSDFKNIQVILKSMNTPLLNKFVCSMNFYQKLLLFLNMETSKSIFEWFDDFKTRCLIKNYPALNFADFMRVVADLISFDIYKMKKDGIQVVCRYLKEEIEQAIKEDASFTEFRPNV